MPAMALFQGEWPPRAVALIDARTRVVAVACSRRSGTLQESAADQSDRERTSQKQGRLSASKSLHIGDDLSNRPGRQVTRSRFDLVGRTNDVVREFPFLLLSEMSARGVKGFRDASETLRGAALATRKLNLRRLTRLAGDISGDVFHLVAEVANALGNAILHIQRGIVAM